MNLEVQTKVDLDDLAHALAKDPDILARVIANSVEDYNLDLLWLIKKVVSELTSEGSNSQKRAFELANSIELNLSKEYPKPEIYSSSSGESICLLH